MCELAIENIGLSDHFLIIFNVKLAEPTIGPESVDRRARPINALVAS